LRKKYSKIFHNILSKCLSHCLIKILRKFYLLLDEIPSPLVDTRNIAIKKQVQTVNFSLFPRLMLVREVV
jgi:hypothetical protein